MSKRTRPQHESGELPVFRGFERPEANWFKMPLDWTNITAGISNLAELKVVEYILRHTWGYHEYDLKKHITVDEFVHGRKRRDGSRMDRGTGLSERAVRYGLQQAVLDGLIEEEVDDRDRGRIRKSYSVRMRPVDGDTRMHRDAQQPEVQTLHPGRQIVPRTVAGPAPRTEKETQERNLYSNIRSISIKDEQPGTADRTDQPTRGADGPTLVAVTLGRRTLPQPARSASDEDRAVVSAYLAGFAQEFSDHAPLASSTSRALRLYQRAGVSREQFIDVLYRARAITRDRSATTRRQMPFFFSVIEDLLGLKEDMSEATERA